MLDKNALKRVLAWRQEPGCTPDTAAGGISFIRELYERQDSQEKSVCFVTSPTTCLTAPHRAAHLHVILPARCHS